MSMFTSNVDEIHIYGQVEPNESQKGHIEQIVFTDGTITIGSQTASQTLNAEAQVQKLNEASNLDEAEKQKRKKAAKKAIEEAKEKKAQDNDNDQQATSSPGQEKKR
jgi:hypothetical protein